VRHLIAHFDVVQKSSSRKSHWPIEGRSCTTWKQLGCSCGVIFHKTVCDSLFIRFVDCRRFCDGQSFHVQHGPTAFNKRLATVSISINYKLQISIDFHNLLNLVRDQGVGGSNPLSPTNCFQQLTAAPGTAKPTHLVLPRRL